MPLGRNCLKLSVLLFGAARPTQPDEKFDVGGYNLYIGCQDTGSLTVILESGLDGDVVTWREIHPEVAKFTRVCRYGHVGLAHSDYNPTLLDAEKIPADLHTLLMEAAEEPLSSICSTSSRHAWPSSLLRGSRSRSAMVIITCRARIPRR